MMATLRCDHPDIFHFINAISKTITISEDYSFQDLKTPYMYANNNHLKGCTTYRMHSKIGAVSENYLR